MTDDDFKAKMEPVLNHLNETFNGMTHDEVCDGLAAICFSFILSMSPDPLTRILIAVQVTQAVMRIVAEQRELVPPTEEEMNHG